MDSADWIDATFGTIAIWGMTHRWSCNWVDWNRRIQAACEYKLIAKYDTYVINQSVEDAWSTGDAMALYMYDPLIDRLVDHINWRVECEFNTDKLEIGLLATWDIWKTPAILSSTRSSSWTKDYDCGALLAFSTTAWALTLFKRKHWAFWIF